MRILHDIAQPRHEREPPFLCASEGAYVGYTADMRRLYCAGAGLYLDISTTARATVPLIRACEERKSPV